MSISRKTDQIWHEHRFSPPFRAGLCAPVAGTANHSDGLNTWWIDNDGSVHKILSRINAPSTYHEPVAPAGSGSFSGSISALHPQSGSYTLWWIGADGSIQEFQAGNRRRQLAPSGSASATGGITSLSAFTEKLNYPSLPNRPNYDSPHLEVWWTGADGSLQATWFRCEHGWRSYELAPSGSVSLTCGITSLSGHPDHREVWWIAPNGSVQGAWYTDANGWNLYELAPAGSAAPESRMACLSADREHREVWWLAPNGSVQAAWYRHGWQRYELAPASSCPPWSGLCCSTRSFGQDMLSGWGVWWISNQSTVTGRFYDRREDRWMVSGIDTLRAHAAPGSIDCAIAEQRLQLLWVSPQGHLTHYVTDSF